MTPGEVLEGDCIEVMATLPAESVDAVVCDPPYGLGFMGKAWDADFVPGDSAMRRRPEMDALNAGMSRQGGRQRAGEDYQKRQARDARAYQAWTEAWAREALRVAKPGAHLLAFGGTRTYHRLACAIEDAGWEIRDCLVWAYASGFPKSLAPYRSILSGQCRYSERAPHAVRVSPWRLLGSSEGKGPTALALAETQPEGELLVLIRTGEEAGSSVAMATPLSAFPMAGMSWSTERSWPDYSGGRWQATSTSIIETVARAITDPTTWSSWASSITATATPDVVSRPDGCECDVLGVARSLSADSANIEYILWPSVAEPATSPLVPLRGLGTAAKPAWEPIVLARKPLRGTVAANVTAYGTGALHVDACRIGFASDADRADTEARMDTPGSFQRVRPSGPAAMLPAPQDGPVTSPLGRWPANLILTDPIFDGDTPGVVGGGEAKGWASQQRLTPADKFATSYHAGLPQQLGEAQGYDDSGTYSRFFLIPKADRADREPVLLPDGHDRDKRFTTHPTVKPTELMRHLVRLVTPPGGIVLDPFGGSGTTALACEMEGFRWLLIEREPEYVAIARARLNGTQRGLGLVG